MKDFKLKDGERVRTVIATKASATVIEAGDLVAMSSGLIIKAVAGSTRLAYAPYGAPAGVTEVEVTVGNDFSLIGQQTADAVFAVTQKGATCDLKGTTTLAIDNDTQSTNVLRIGIGKDAGVVGSAKNIEVKIELPLF